MSSIPQKLATLLGQIRRPGDFYATGTIDIHPPRLEVESVGQISLPLLPAQAEQIIAVSERAPYGLGTETRLDTNVRRTWQIGAEQVRISGKVWDQDLSVMVAQAAEGLGITGPVQAEIYKLLVYDTGSFFVQHRDSEKAPGMFATLVVVLPSDYDGGELLVQHKGREVRLDLRRDEPSEAAFAAFYADCLHEVLPVVSGYRLALIYNLVRKEAQPLPKPPGYELEQQQVVTLLRAWTEQQESVPEAESDPAIAPTKLIYPLEHAYTQAELGFSALKGADAAVASVMTPAAHQSDCDLYLALVSIAESGWAEYAGGGGYRRGYWDDSDAEFEIGEVEESSLTVHDWRHPDGSCPPLGQLPFLLDELSPPDAFEDLEPDELDFQEAAGNAGATFDRLYQRAAFVLWPRSRRSEVVSQGGLQASVPFLGELVRRWRDSGADPEGVLWREAHGLAAQIRRDWPDAAWTRQRASDDGWTGALLQHLIALGDITEIDAFLIQRTADGAYGKNDNHAVTEALGQLTPTRASEMLTAIVSHNAPARSAACADLLARCASTSLAPAALMRPAAEALVQSLPDGKAHTPTADFSHRPQAPTSQMVVDVLNALEGIDPALAARALTHFFSYPEPYPMDEVLVPTALCLYESGYARGYASAQVLREAVVVHLSRRIAEPLEPPADWRRPSAVSCTCTYCRDLSRFLADPAQSTWLLKAAQTERSHVESSIRSNTCDVDFVTEQKGRPYTLRCNKNQASYERRVEQRRQDLERLARLDGKTSDEPWLMVRSR
jgi:predicted 2-oxoglutarate/Fe(II)-dependent dioxygenase YbiX